MSVLPPLLLDVADLSESNAFTRGKALALAYALGQHRSVIERDFAFRFGSDRSTNRPNADATKARIEEQLKKISSSDVAPYLNDLLRSMGGQGVDGIRDPDWSAVFPQSQIPVSASAPTQTASNQAPANRMPGRIYFDQISDTPSSSGGGAVGGFKRRQSLIKGLLVIQLEGSQFAGGASQMNATVTSGSPGSDTEVTFNQGVGEMMESGLVKVLEFINQKHGDVPDGQRIEVSFESQYSPKDGDSASTACALMIDALITGEEIDPGFAVTGALSTDGDVEAVGGIDGKIRGATNRDCTHVAIPKVNEDVLSDMLITDGIGPLAAIQVFTIDTFDSAHALAASPNKRDAKINESIELFATVQKVLLRNNGQAMLKNTQVQQRLRKVVELTPNHASARLLLLKAIGRSNSQLTLQGSLTAIDRAALPLIQGLRNKDYRGGANPLDSDEFGASVSNLKRIRPQLDKRAWDTADAITEFAEAFRILRNNPPKSPKALSELGSKIESSGNRVERHYGELVDEIRRELGIEDDE
ncbi:MAG: S16 family serine protease [Verrucomicrobiota bacterium]